jgi:hypothetical protein
MTRAARRRLENEWKVKLKASGFADLEGQDRDGPLSDRGNLHESGDEDAAPLEERIDHGSAYHTWAHDVLRKLNGHDARSRLRRRIWALHADGWRLKEIAREIPGINFHNARDTVRAIKEKYECREEDDAVRLVRGTNSTILTTLASKIIAAHLRQPPSPHRLLRETKTPTESSIRRSGASGGT